MTPGKAHKTCGCCGRSMAKAVAVTDGVAYCATCYAREFKKVPCAQCGKTMRSLGGKTPVTCRSCKAQDRHCVRCGKPVPRAGLTVEEGVVCPSCVRYYKEPRPCAVCGQKSLRLSRDFQEGFTEPVCNHCRRKSYITCPSCGKHRRPAGPDGQGRIVCKQCLERTGPFLCPQCGQEGRAHSKTRCEACYWKDAVDKRMRSAVALLSRPWTKEAFSGFTLELRERVGAQPAAMRLEKYFLYFAKLDTLFTTPGDITAEKLIMALGREGLRRYAVPQSYLIRHGIVPAFSDEALQAASAEAAQIALLTASEEQWYAGLLRRFHAHLAEINARYRTRGWQGKQQRFVPRTVTTALRAAKIFLDFLEIGPAAGVQHIQQMQLDRFLVEHPGYRDGIRAFVRFLNRKEKLFRKLKIESVQRNLPKGLILDRDRYTSLLRAWLNPADDVLKASLISTLMLLYAQPAKHLVRLRLTDLAQGATDGMYRVIFGRTEITLDPRVGHLLARYLERRRALATMEETDDTDWLFPGRRHGGHLHEAIVSYYLKKQGVTANSLFTTAIYYAYLGGLRHPKVLVKAFGITDYTAVKYLQMIDPRLTAEVEARFASR